MSFLDKLKERTKQIKAAIGDAAAVRRVDEDIRNHRLEICTGCEHLFQATHQCKKCGCFVKAKTWLPSQVCPVGKWPAVDTKE